VRRRAPPLPAPQGLELLGGQPVLLLQLPKLTTPESDVLPDVLLRIESGHDSPPLLQRCEQSLTQSRRGGRNRPTQRSTGGRQTEIPTGSNRRQRYISTTTGAVEIRRSSRQWQLTGTTGRRTKAATTGTRHVRHLSPANRRQRTRRTAPDVRA